MMKAGDDIEGLCVVPTYLNLVHVVSRTFSGMGDAHAAQGDSELDGTGIETSITGKFKISLIKAADFDDAMKIQDFPLGETKDEWIIHAFTFTDYLKDFADNPGGVYSNSSLDPAMKNAFTQARDWMMAKYDLSEYEAWTIITQAVNFGMTQLVDGNWGVHAVIPKGIFEGVSRKAECGSDEIEENEGSEEESKESGAASLMSSLTVIVTMLASLLVS
jgi:acetamidase/formamidase